MKKLLFIVAVITLSHGGFVFAQGHDDVIKAAYAKTHTPTGREFRVTRYKENTQARLEKDLEIAKAVMEEAPDRSSSYEWLGRRYGYLGMLPEAIEVFSNGLKKFPDSYKLYRYRGRHLARNYQYHRAVNYLKGNYTREEFLEIADVIGKYTVAMKDLFDGDEENARKLFNETTDSGPRGFWPSEAELMMLDGK